MVKPLPAVRKTWVPSLDWKIPWRRKWQPTPVLLPGKSHGRRSLVGYSPWGCKESDTTEQLHFLSFQFPFPSYNPAYILLVEHFFWWVRIKHFEKPSLTPYVCMLGHFSHVWVFATPWTVAHQAPLSMGILQARILEWVVMPSCTGLSQPRDWTWASHIEGRFFTFRAIMLKPINSSTLLSRHYMILA